MLVGPEGRCLVAQIVRHTHTAFGAKADMGNGAAQMSAYDQKRTIRNREMRKFRGPFPNPQVCYDI